MRLWVVVARLLARQPAGAIQPVFKARALAAIKAGRVVVAGEVVRDSQVEIDPGDVLVRP
jgi:hypothetical protein